MFLFKKPDKQKLLFLYLTQSFRAVAVSFLAFFSSIFIYKQFLQQTENPKLALLAVIVFNLVLYLSKLVSVCLAEETALRYGLKKDIIFGNIFVVLALLAFAFSEKHLGILWLGAIFWGVSIGYFWFGRHGLLAKIGNREQYGRCSGGASALSMMMLILVPFVSGFLIGKVGYTAIFLASLVFIFLSIISAVLLKEEKTHRDTDIKEVWKLMKTHKRMTLTYFSGGGIGVFYSIPLILFVFLNLETESAFGGFYSLSMFLVALASLGTGRWIDKRGKKDLIAYGAVIAAIVWLGRFVVGTMTAFFFFDVIDRIAKGMTGLSLDVLSFEKAIDGHSTGRAILFRELGITVGSIFSCLVLFVLIWLEVELKTTFLLGSLFSLLPLLIVRKKKLLGEYFHGGDEAK